MTTPAGWTPTSLGSLGQYINGRGFKKSEWATDGRPIIRIQNLTRTSDSFNYFRGDVEDRYVVRPGDLLVSWAATLGSYFWPGPEGVLNQHIFKVESRIDVRFHKYLLDHKLDELMRHTHGSGMVHITRSNFDSLPVDIPPLDEQRRIVDILEDHLSRLDAAETGMRVAATRTVSLRAAFLDALFAEAPTSPLRSVVERVEAGRSFGGSAAPAREDQWGIIKVSAMTWGNFRAEENKAIDAALADARYEIHRGDLLVSRANTTAYVGASVLVGKTRPRLLLSDKSLRLVPVDGILTEWLHLALSAPRVRSQISTRATGTKDSMRNISQSALLSVDIPSVRHDRQNADIAVARANEDARRAIARQIDMAGTRTAALRRALLAAAFSGRLTGRSSDLDLAEEIAHT